MGPTCNHLHGYKWQVGGDFFCPEGKEKAAGPQSRDWMLPRAQECRKQEEASNGFSPRGIRGSSGFLTIWFWLSDADFRPLTSGPLREYISVVLTFSVVFVTAHRKLQLPGWVSLLGYVFSFQRLLPSKDCILVFQDACIISAIKELIAKWFV